MRHKFKNNCQRHQNKNSTSNTQSGSEIIWQRGYFYSDDRTEKCQCGY